MSAARAMMQDDGALDLRPFAKLLDLKARAMRVAAVRVRALGHALELITARVEREPVHEARRDALRREAAEARRRAKVLSEGLAPVEVVGADLEMVRLTETAIGDVEKGARGAPALRARLQSRISELGLRLTEVHEVKAVERRIVETVRLDASREGVAIEAVIERARGVRYLRLTTRDGLKLLHERDAFHPRDEAGAVRRDPAADREAALLMAVGLRYRELYERAGPRLKSSLSIDGAPVREQRTFEREVRAAHRRAAQSGVLRKWEAKVARRLGDDALLALRAVAGEAKTLRSLKIANRRMRRLTGLLRDALLLLADEVVKGA